MSFPLILPPARKIDGDSLTQLLFHMDGANGSTLVPDTSYRGNPQPSLGSGIAIATDQSVFGGTSLKQTTTANQFSLPHQAWMDFGAGNFSIDFRYRMNGAIAPDHSIMVISNQLMIFAGAGGGSTNTLQLYVSSNGSSWNLASGVSSGLTIGFNAWYHVGVHRVGNDFYISRDGTFSSSLLNTATAIAATSNAMALFGGNSSISEWCDEFRASNTARWTSSFTPPASAYS